jgi:CheY-like chemotaxis protein
MGPERRSRSLIGNRVNRSFSILFSVAFTGWLGCSPAVARAATVEATTGHLAIGAPEPASEQARAMQAAADEPQTRARVEHFAELEAAQRARSQLEASHYRDVLELQAARATAWSDVLRTNWAAYEALRQQAVNSPRHTASCTICNGRGSLAFCIVCGNNGKCVRCNGTGKAFGELCTTCRGNGKCFLCFGTGKMTCLFCDDGDVYLNGAPPPKVMPVPSAPTVQPSPRPAIALEPLSSPFPVNASASASAPQNDPQAQPPPDVAPPGTSRSNLAVALALLLGGILLLRKLAPSIAELVNQRFNPWKPLATAAKGSPAGLAEAGSYSEFVAEFRIGPQAPSMSAPPLRSSKEADLAGKQAECPIPEANPLQRFLESAPKQVQGLRRSLQEIGRAQDEAARQGMLKELSAEMHRLKCMAGLPELLPAWQMACALDWLVKQLTERGSRVTPSTLRTVANGVDLLQELCRPGLRTDLCANPPIRLLAVDDDAVSRHAISFALKKGLNPADLAEDGPAALALATKHSYDVIFLDVQMPGMDGFEVCSRIHDTTPNRTTPVVFVTMHSDFEARAKSTLCGGNDLIAKPFLTFEITVKALTLALRTRLLGDHSIAEASASTTRADGAAVSPPVPVAATTGLAPGPAAPSAASSAPAQNQPSTSTPHPECLPACKADSGHGAVSRGAPGISTADDVPGQAAALVAGGGLEAFFVFASAQLEATRELVQQASQAKEERARQAIMVDLYRRASSLRPPLDCAELRPALQVSVALEGLLKKLLEHPKNASPSALQTLAAAVDLLGDLCVPGLPADLASSPPVHLLVVDDDPLGRGAIAGGLQLAFGRPDSAPDGEKAVALATEKAFDVVFMDVEMPGMDGLTACARIRETAANRDTPVVFVTMHADAETRRACGQCGGSDFISKPFLCSELTLKALTFTLRGRLQKLEPVEGKAAATEAKDACLVGAL